MFGWRPLHNYTFAVHELVIFQIMDEEFLTPTANTE